jgi:hypothetical protein
LSSDNAISETGDLSMTKLVRGQAPFILAALIALSPVVSATVQEHEGQKIVEFTKILAHPEAFQGIEVAFVVQFHELNDSDNPVFTRFLGEWDLNFAAWADGAELWTRAGYLADHPYFFAKRGSVPAETVLKAQIYSRWMATGIVRRVFKDKPWIQVTSLSRLGTQIDQPSLTALAKGFKLANDGQHVQAALAFRAAEHNRLPTNVRAVAIHQEAISLHDAGRIEESIRRLETGRGIMPEDPGLNWSLQTYRNELAALRDGGEELAAIETAEPGVPEGQQETVPPTEPETEPTEPRVIEPTEVVKNDPQTTDVTMTESTEPAKRWPDLPEPTLTQPAPKQAEAVEPEPETQVVEPTEQKLIETEQVQPETTEPEVEKPKRVWHDLPEPKLTYPKPKTSERTQNDPLPPVEPETSEPATEPTEPQAATVEPVEPVEPEVAEPEMVESTEPEAMEPVTPEANPVPVAIVHPDPHPVAKAEPAVVEPVAAEPEVMEEPVPAEQPMKRRPVQKASLEIVPAIPGRKETTRTHEAAPRTTGTPSN